MRQHCCRGIEGELYLSGHLIDYCGCLPFVRHMHHFHAGHRTEHFHQHVRTAAVASGSVDQIARACLGERHQILDRFDRQRGMCRQHAGQHGHQRHMTEILDRIKPQFLVNRRGNGLRHRHHANGVAVGRRFGALLGADIAGRSCAVIGEYLNTPGACQPVCSGASHQISRPTGRKRNNEAYRLRRIALRQCRQGNRTQCGN